MKTGSTGSWASQYKDPKWQKMRLEIMERDNFACRSCGATDKTLNVHHAYYEKGKKPWEYPEETLVTMCEECHKERHQYRKIIDVALNNITNDELSILTVIIEDGTIDDGDTLACILHELEISRTTIGITKAMQILNDASFIHIDAFSAGRKTGAIKNGR